MKYMANKLGYSDEAEFWGICGLLHDVDFEMWPEEHCKKSRRTLEEAGVDEKNHPRSRISRLWRMF